jgi:hypothetical protein
MFVLGAASERESEGLLPTHVVPNIVLWWLACFETMSNVARYLMCIIIQGVTEGGCTAIIKWFVIIVQGLSFISVSGLTF